MNIHQIESVSALFLLVQKPGPFFKGLILNTVLTLDIVGGNTVWA